MGFIQAIRSGFKNYFVFTGTAKRPEYWYWFLFNIALAGIGYLLIDWAQIWFYQILLLFLPTLSVTVRRLRDAGYSWVWLLLKLPGIIPLIIGYIVFFSAWFRLTLGGGLNWVAGNEDQAIIQIALAREEFRGAVLTISLAIVYMASSIILVWGVFTARKSKSFEEGNKRVPPKNIENPAI